MPRPERTELLLAAIVVVGAVLRVATLGTQSFWFDEAQLAHEATLSFSGLWHTIGAQETSPPLYFVLAWLWAKAFGTGEVALRSLSALLGILTVPLAYACGRELVSRRAGLLAAAFAAASPFLIWYSQEAREYMLLVAASATSLWGFARAWNAPRPDGPAAPALAIWAGGSPLALLSHFLAGFLVAPEAALLLWRWRSRRAVVAAAIPLVTELALLPLAISDTNHPLGWLQSIPLHTRIEQVPIGFALNTLDQTSAVNWSLIGAALVAAAVIVLLVGGSPGSELRGAAVAAALSACVLLVPLVIALAGHDYYIVRALSPAWVPLAVVLAAACTAPRLRLAGAALGLVTLVAFGYAQARILGDTDLQRPDWRGAADALGPARVPRAVVADDGSLSIDPLALYLPGVPWRGSAAPATVHEIDVIGSPFGRPGRLPAGVRLIERRRVGGFAVTRFALSTPLRGTPAALGTYAAGLVVPSSAAPAVLIQPAEPAKP